MRLGGGQTNNGKNVRVNGVVKADKARGDVC